MYQQTLQRLMHRPENANKYEFGHVLVLGGAPGMVGAPLLAAMAAMRVGAGLVTIASTDDVIDKIEEHTLEVMTMRLSGDDQQIIEAIVRYMRTKKVTAVVAGSGMGPTLAQVVPQLLERLDAPAVLDAAALTVFGGQLERLATTARHKELIMTPHDGEYQRLTGVELPQRQPDRSSAAASFAQKHGLTLICKGHHTVVAHPDGTVYVEEQGNPGLAKAGTGDVLSGVLGGLLAQRVVVSEAAELGVHLHALAGDLAMEEETEAGIIASDVVDLIPDALRKTSQEI